MTGRCGTVQSGGWEPGQYLRFETPRLRPAADLIARIPAESPELVCDLGCGPGNATALLRRRWPSARVVGVDNAPTMLAAARREHAADAVEWQEADIAEWRPDAPPDVISANASLHWLDGHDILLPRLLRSLAPEGWLAVQMPRNFGAPSHTAIGDTIIAGPWRARLQRIWRPEPVAPPSHYHRLLEPLADSLDVWETTYLHRLTGRDPVLEWTRGTVLAPLLAALEEGERAAFLDDYGDRLRAAYPPESDGSVLFAFRRLFIVAGIK